MVAPYRDRPMFGGTADAFQRQPMFGRTDIASDVIWTEPPEQTRRSFDPNKRFRVLADEWHAATDHLSSPTQIATHPAYQKIIAMGPIAIPFILEDLRARGGQWYWALKYLAGQSPVPKGAAGNTHKVKEAWFRWGRAAHYI